MIPAGAIKRFQSTLPAREATGLHIHGAEMGDISIHASRGGSDHTGPLFSGVDVISIHASREGSDDVVFFFHLLCILISIHASRGGSDPFPWPSALAYCRFQSTLPAGDATQSAKGVYKGEIISIHASRGGCDRVKVLLVEKNAEFQSTLPAREATPWFRLQNWRPGHFNPRFSRGKRHQSGYPPVRLPYFNPRFLRGMRHWVSNQKN